MAEPSSRVNRTICIPFPEETYRVVLNDPKKFREHMNSYLKQHPEPFPVEIHQGYKMKDIYYSKKLELPIRRISIDGKYYTIRPSFIMPHLTGLVKDVEMALLLRKFDVPFWALTRIFGKNNMYWYRLECMLGRNSLVGTTVQTDRALPAHVVADEKHTWIQGKKAYIACSAAQGCVLGASVAASAGEEDLTRAYKVFKEESQQIQPDYTPETVTMDGWSPTRKAWKALFPVVSVILCFLHVYIKIRDGAKKKHKEIYDLLADRLWNCYRAPNRVTFSQRVRRLMEWAKMKKLVPSLMERVEKLHERRNEYSVAYQHPGAHRTTNQVDRLMQQMDRHLTNTFYFHGGIGAAELSIRGWVLIKNFAPWNPGAVKRNSGKQCPAERLNEFRYHENWLQNLLISASGGGYRFHPLKPLQ